MKSVISRRLVFFALLGVIVLLIVSGENIRQSAFDGLCESVTKVIPSVFPFMIIGRLISRVEVPRAIGTLVSAMFGLPDSAANAIIIGLLGSYPSGAVCTETLYKNGSISKEDAMRLLPISHNTGPAFPVSCIGILMWSSKIFGIALYVSQIISAVIVGMIFSCGSRRERKSISAGHPEYDFVSALTHAVVSSSETAVIITGFVTLSRIFVNLVFSFIPVKTPVLRAALSAVTELSCGAANSASLGNLAGAALCGFAVGFGGVCAMLQAVSAVSKSGIVSWQLTVSKIAQGMICAPLSAAAYVLIKPIPSAYSATYTSVGIIPAMFASAILLIGFVSIVRRILMIKHRGVGDIEHKFPNKY